MKGVGDFINAAISSLGETLLGRKHLLMRVADANILPNTLKSFTVTDLNPSIANRRGGPESIILPAYWRLRKIICCRD